MLKITDPNYELPLYDAQVFIKELTSGANAPILVRAMEVNSKDMNEVVAKISYSERMNPTAFMREMLALFIAKELELKIPEPIVVNISREFADSIDDPAIHNRVFHSLGHHFGTIYLPNFPVFAHVLVKKALFPIMQKIFIFDMFIENPDRTFLKPNMLLDQNDIYIFDHEMAFSFIMDAGDKDQNKIWHIGDAHRYLADFHVLFSIIRRSNFVNDDFIDKLGSLNDHFWSRAETIIPSEWLDKEIFDKIKNNLFSKIKHLQYYKEEIKRLLS